MLKDFVKLETFLTTVRERSFSKASAKLGISQPAVTQQIKFLESYLNTPIIERKKNGIKLTAEGEELYKILIRLEKAIHTAEIDLIKIINKEMTFRLGASFTIGTYVIPGECLGNLKKVVNNDVTLNIALSQDIINQIKDKKIDIGLIESPIMDNDLIYREWLEDELIVISNVPIPKIIQTEELYDFQWICREESSHTRKMMVEVFDELGVNCKDFKMRSEVNHTTAVLQGIKKSKKDLANPVVSIISKYAVADEIQNGQLFEARIRGYEIKRKFYIVYSKENKRNAFIENIVDYILNGRC
ncbi:MAG: LysR family transcriptional regulator [Sulfurovaceae bacterium]|jgi:LysR family transcriptional regulator, transcriptional activator of the cysJI operon|nr:LysR family transcriptional regulator [Sulfurovaceae bacterium]